MGIFVISQGDLLHPRIAMKPICVAQSIVSLVIML